MSFSAPAVWLSVRIFVMVVMVAVSVSEKWKVSEK